MMKNTPRAYRRERASVRRNQSLQNIRLMRNVTTTRNKFRSALEPLAEFQLQGPKQILL